MTDGQDHVLSQADALTKKQLLQIIANREYVSFFFWQSARLCPYKLLFSQSVSLTQYVVLSVHPSACLPVRSS